MQASLEAVRSVAIYPRRRKTQPLEIRVILNWQSSAVEQFCRLHNNLSAITQSHWNIPIVFKRTHKGQNKEDSHHHHPPFALLDTLMAYCLPVDYLLQNVTDKVLHFAVDSLWPSLYSNWLKPVLSSQHSLGNLLYRFYCNAWYKTLVIFSLAGFDKAFDDWRWWQGGNFVWKWTTCRSDGRWDRLNFGLLLKVL